jgi:5-methylthioadenosine/S-adenosylhomocysteine deaminase
MFRGAIVLTMDPVQVVVENGDVLVSDGEIVGIGRDLPAPDDAVEIDSTGGILMPGMIDTHRHMWNTVMRGYGADWTLTDYFYFYYINWGGTYRPQDIYASNLLSAIEGVDAGVTTTVDWAHGLRTTDHADAAVDALEEVPGRFVLAYGNVARGPWEWTTTAAFKDFVVRRMTGKGPMLGFQMAFDVTGDPDFPEQAAFDVARELDTTVTMHSGVWGQNGDASIRLMSAKGVMSDRIIYVHAASLSDNSYERIAGSGGYASVAAESECNVGQGYPSTGRLIRHGIPISLSTDTSTWWSGDMFSAMRATLNAERALQHLEAHRQDATVITSTLRARDIVEYATMGGANALGLGSVIGSITQGKRADLVLIKNDASPVMFPILHPYGHVAFQAGRGDVHTVVIDGRVVKYAGRLLLGDQLVAARRAVDETVAYFRATMGEEVWSRTMHPEPAKVDAIDNPYQYVSGPVER